MDRMRTKQRSGASGAAMQVVLIRSPEVILPGGRCYAARLARKVGAVENIRVTIPPCKFAT